MRDRALMEVVSLGPAFLRVSTSMESLPPPQIPLADERWCDEIRFQPLLLTPNRVTIPLARFHPFMVPLPFDTSGSVHLYFIHYTFSHSFTSNNVSPFHARSSQYTALCLCRLNNENGNRFQPILDSLVNMDQPALQSNPLYYYLPYKVHTNTGFEL